MNLKWIILLLILYNLRLWYFSTYWFIWLMSVFNHHSALIGVYCYKWILIFLVIIVICFLIFSISLRILNIFLCSRFTIKSFKVIRCFVCKFWIIYFHIICRSILFLFPILSIIVYCCISFPILLCNLVCISNR